MNLIKAIEQLRCADINFKNVEKMNPGLLSHPIYKLAKIQFDEGLKLLEEE